MKPQLAVILSISFLLLLLLLSAFFSGAETALISLNRIRLRYLAEKGNKRARLVQKLLFDMDDLITAILVGNNFVNTGISVTGTILFAYLLGPKAGGLVAFLVIGIAVLIFGETTPKLFAAQHSQKVSLAVAFPMRLVVRALRPLAIVLGGISDIIIRLFGGEPSAKSQRLTEEEIKLMIELGREQGVVQDEERKMLNRIFKFGDTVVSDVMVSKEEIVAVDIDTDLNAIIDTFIKSGFARIPVYNKDPARIVGIIYTKELVDGSGREAARTAKDLMQAPYFVSKDTKVINLLRDLRKRKGHIAIVTEEGGRPIGLVTLEDLLEEIVGEIE